MNKLDEITDNVLEQLRVGAEQPNRSFNPANTIKQALEEAYWLGAQAKDTKPPSVVFMPPEAQ
jgi:hypothetical protein